MGASRCHCCLLDGIVTKEGIESSREAAGRATERAFPAEGGQEVPLNKEGPRRVQSVLQGRHAWEEQPALDSSRGGKRGGTSTDDTPARPPSGTSPGRVRIRQGGVAAGSCTEAGAPVKSPPSPDGFATCRNGPRRVRSESRLGSDGCSPPRGGGTSCWRGGRELHWKPRDSSRAPTCVRGTPRRRSRARASQGEARPKEKGRISRERGRLNRVREVRGAHGVTLASESLSVQRAVSDRGWSARYRGIKGTVRPMRAARREGVAAGGCTGSPEPA